MLFGNGLSLNLIGQLKPLVTPNKHYLLNIDDFLKAFIKQQLSPREENIIFKTFYTSKNISNLKHFKILKDDLSRYFTAHDANIEYWLGADLFCVEKCGYDFLAIKTVFPVLYNIWHEIMLDYFTYLNLNENIIRFGNSVMSLMNRTSHVYTTNFDRLFENLNPEHLHGTFVKSYVKQEQLIFSFIDSKTYYYKCLWGWNGIGKLSFIEDIKGRTGYENYFDFDFFYDKDVHIENLLIYGMGFQISGYMKAISASIPKYTQPTVGGVIDEHILMRLKGLQEHGQLKNITFACYSDSEKQYYKQLVSCYDIKKVDYKMSSSFNFSI